MLYSSTECKIPNRRPDALCGHKGHFPESAPAAQKLRNGLLYALRVLRPLHLQNRIALLVRLSRILCADPRSYRPHRKSCSSQRAILAELAVLLVFSLDFCITEVELVGGGWWRSMIPSVCPVGREVRRELPRSPAASRGGWRSRRPRGCRRSPADCRPRRTPPPRCRRPRRRCTAWG
jgi:hypothetical protein